MSVTDQRGSLPQQLFERIADDRFDGGLENAARLGVDVLDPALGVEQQNPVQHGIEDCLKIAGHVVWLPARFPLPFVANRTGVRTQNEKAV